MSSRLHQDRQATGPPVISVVIPTCQRRDSLARTVAALTRQTMSADGYEVVVSIDGSVDGTEEMLAAFKAPCPLIWRWQPNHGRAAACNLGVSMARGELIVLLDDDMEPVPGFLDAHAAAHSPGTRRAVVGAAPVITEERSNAAAQYIARKFNRHLARLAVAGYRFTLRDFYSGNCSIPRSVLLEVGGFDEAFTIYGNEDLELSWRLMTAGVEVVFSTDAVARQHYTKDLPALARDNIAKGRTAVLLAAKHPSASSHLKLTSHARTPFLRRISVGLLLALTRVWPSTSDVVIGLTGRLGRLRPRSLDRLYSVVLDYFYFVGAAAAREEARGENPALTPAP